MPSPTSFDSAAELKKLANEFREDEKSSGWDELPANHPIKRFVDSIKPNPTIKDIAVTIPEKVATDLAEITNLPTNPRLAETLHRIAEPEATSKTP